MEKIFSTSSLNWIYLLVGIILGLLNIFQFFKRRQENKDLKMLVRSWQNHIEGIKNALLAVTMDPEKNKEPGIVLGNLQAVSQQAAALDKAMTEERFYDDKELKKKRDKQQQALEQLLERPKEQEK